MRHCIPDELFNAIPAPPDTGDTTLKRIVAEIRYKIPSATDLLVMKEVWHSLCDFCFRTGALVERFDGAQETSESPDDIMLEPRHGRFLRIVGAGNTQGRTNDFKLIEGLDCIHAIFECRDNNYVLVSVAPRFSDAEISYAEWNPSVPEWFIDRYGEVITHGALMRLFVMSNRPWTDPALARMHAVAYNNDLNRISFGLITSGMRKHLLIDVEDWVATAGGATNGNG